MLVEFPVLIPFAALILSEAVKTAIASIRERRFATEWFFHSGGMPSGHSAFVTSMMTVVAIAKGIESIEFLIAVVIAAIVMRDAIGLRAQVGLHAHLLNALQTEIHLEKAVGHKMSQVIAGAIFGVLMGAAAMQF